MKEKSEKSNPQFNAAIIGSTFLCGLGLFFLITRHAAFTLGGHENSGRGAEAVNAGGLGAIAWGLFFISLGILNLAQYMRSRRRIPVFWIGAGLFLVSALSGIVSFFV